MLNGSIYYIFVFADTAFLPEHESVATTKIDHDMDGDDDNKTDVNICIHTKHIVHMIMYEIMSMLF